MDLISVGTWVEEGDAMAYLSRRGETQHLIIVSPNVPIISHSESRQFECVINVCRHTPDPYGCPRAARLFPNKTVRGLQLPISTSCPTVDVTGVMFD